MVIAGAVRQQPRDVPAAIIAAHFPLNQIERLEYAVGVVGKIRIIQAVSDIQQRASRINGQHAEYLGGPRGKPFDPHTAINKHGGDVRGGDQVLQIVIDLAGFLDLGLQLIVDRDQFFVDGLQLFLAGLQLLGGRAQFLVDGLQLFIRGPELLVRCARLLQRVLQMQLGPLQLLFQQGQHTVLAWVFAASRLLRLG